MSVLTEQTQTPTNKFIGSRGTDYYVLTQGNHHLFHDIHIQSNNGTYDPVTFQ